MESRLPSSGKNGGFCIYVPLLKVSAVDTFPELVKGCRCKVATALNRTGLTNTMPA